MDNFNDMFMVFLLLFWALGPEGGLSGYQCVCKRLKRSTETSGGREKHSGSDTGSPLWGRGPAGADQSWRERLWTLSQKTADSSRTKPQKPGISFKQTRSQNILHFTHGDQNSRHLYRSATLRATTYTCLPNVYL